jgi:hypothetical protein
MFHHSGTLRHSNSQPCPPACIHHGNSSTISLLLAERCRLSQGDFHRAARQLDWAQGRGGYRALSRTLQSLLFSLCSSLGATHSISWFELNYRASLMRMTLGNTNLDNCWSSVLTIAHLARPLPPSYSPCSPTWPSAYVHRPAFEFFRQAVVAGYHMLGNALQLEQLHGPRADTTQGDAITRFTKEEALCNCTGTGDNCVPRPSWSRSTLAGTAAPQSNSSRGNAAQQEQTCMGHAQIPHQPVQSHKDKHM